MEVLPKLRAEESTLGSADLRLHRDSCSSVLEHYKIRSTLQVDQGDFIRLLEDIKRLETELYRAVQGDVVDDDDDITRYEKMSLPRPKPREIAAMQDRGIAGNRFAARAIHTGAARAEQKEEADPRLQRPARPSSLVGGGGGATAAGSAAAHRGLQVQRASAADQAEHRRHAYAQRRASKAQSLNGGGKSGTDEVGGTGAQQVKNKKSAAAECQRRMAAARGTYAAAAKISVESEHVAGGGGNSREFSDL